MKSFIKSLSKDLKYKAGDINLPRYIKFVSKRERAEDQIEDLIKEIENMNLYELREEDRKVLIEIKNSLKDQIMAHYEKMSKDFSLIYKDKKSLRDLYKSLKVINDKPKASKGFVEFKDEKPITIDSKLISKKLIDLLQQIEIFEKKIKRLNRNINKIKSPKF